MKTRSSVVLPHHVLDEADVTCEPADGWRIVEAAPTGAETIVRDGDLIESWDASRPLQLARSVTLPPDLATRLGLQPDTARFAVIVVGTTGRGVHREVLFRTDVHTDGSSLQLQICPRGDRLLRDLHLSTAVVVVDPGVGGAALAPSAPGARLWENVVRFQLEGDRPRLPMQVLSFRSTPAFRGFEDALFHVHVAADGGVGVEQGLLVHLNSDDAAFVSRIEACEPVATALLHDAVVRQVLREALAHDLISEDTDIAGTLGGTARRWLEMSFRGRNIDEVANLARERPAEFEAVVQSWCGAVQGLFREVQGQ